MLYKALRNNRDLHVVFGVDVENSISGRFTEENVNEIAYIYATKLAEQLTDGEYDAYMGFMGYDNYRTLLDKLSNIAIESVLGFASPDETTLPTEDFTKEDTTLN